MRDIPGLSQATLDQAHLLSVRAEVATKAAPISPPRASLPEPVVDNGVA